MLEHNTNAVTLLYNHCGPCAPRASGALEHLLDLLGGLAAGNLFAATVHLELRLQLRDLRRAAAEGLDLAVGARDDLDEWKHLDAETLAKLLVVVEHDLVEFDLAKVGGSSVCRMHISAAQLSS